MLFRSIWLVLPVLSASLAYAAQKEEYIFTAPLDGDVITAGHTAVISWNSTASSSALVSFYLETDKDEGNVLYTIATSIENTGAITWRAPTNVSEGDDFVISLIPEADEDHPYYSESFSISNSTSSTTYYPTEGQKYDAGSTMVLTWKVDDNVQYVSIYLMQGNNIHALQNISTVATAIENTGNIGYIIPSGTAMGTNYYFEIVSVNDTDTVVYSQKFTVISEVTSAETSAAAASAASASSLAAKTISSAISSTSAVSSSALSSATSSSGGSSSTTSSSATASSSTGAAVEVSPKGAASILAFFWMILNLL
ncbi:uncharacterized protein V2V93DRAFT_374427 [Kockiozyma suomiensis]|uniref:uncharacterized protein n=1 Tax=Kockiozyma suomiensis TaxID=1337062 RepID=UPI003342F847